MSWEEFLLDCFKSTNWDLTRGHSQNWALPLCAAQRTELSASREGATAQMLLSRQPEGCPHAAMPQMHKKHTAKPWEGGSHCCDTIRVICYY